MTGLHGKVAMVTGGARGIGKAIAAALEIPPNTAASRYLYGLDKLRERLRPIYEEMKNAE